MTDWDVFFFFGEDDDGEITNSRHSRRSCFVISAEGGMTNKWSEAEKIAGSDFSRAKRARRARIRDDTRKSS